MLGTAGVPSLDSVQVFRIVKEEQVLVGKLPGYQEYCQQTRYRLVPLVW